MLATAPPSTFRTPEKIREAMGKMSELIKFNLGPKVLPARRCASFKEFGQGLSNG